MSVSPSGRFARMSFTLTSCGDCGPNDRNALCTRLDTKYTGLISTLGVVICANACASLVKAGGLCAEVQERVCEHCTLEKERFPVCSLATAWRAGTRRMV